MVKFLLGLLLPARLLGARPVAAAKSRRGAGIHG
jgi:hypothetical protein